jgi:Ni/Fe-hydrogenase subunit HybB-like protein
MFIIELVGCVFIPMMMFANRKIRQSVSGLFIGATLVVLGVVLNRVDVFLVAYKPLFATKTYFPSFFEFAVTIGLICLLVLIYRAIVMIFPVISAHSTDSIKSYASVEEVIGNKLRG